MKLLLLQPYLGRLQPPVFPIGLACLAAHLPGHELHGLDLNVTPEPLEVLRQTLQTLVPDAVLVSLRNVDSVWYSDPFCYLPFIQDQIRQIRAQAPQARIIMGGTGFTIFAREVMARTPEIGLGVIGEAEEMIEGLLTQKHPPEYFPNVLYREGTVLKGGTQVGIASMKDYLFPRYDLFSMEPYVSELRGVGLETKRGCPLSCSYCTYPRLNGSRLRLIPPATIVGILRELKERFGVKRFHLTDSIFNIPRGHADKFLQELVEAKLGLKWDAYFHESYFDEELLDLSLEAGCDKFWFSPDGYTPHALKALGKEQTVADVKRAWNLVTSRKNVKADFNLFWQFPDMSWRDFGAMVGFYLWHSFRSNGEVTISLNQIRIEPGTAIQEQAVAEGLIGADDPLLPTHTADLMRMFYHRRRRGFFEWSYDFFLNLKELRWNLKLRLKRLKKRLSSALS